MRADPTSNYLKDVSVWTLQELLETTFKLEQEWLSSAFALYDYAARHAKGLTVDGKLKFPTEKSRLEFIKLQTASTVLFRKFQETTLKNQADYKRARAAADLTKEPKF